MNITREQFDIASAAVWSELEYQNNLPRRTEVDEAKGPDGFATLARVYVRKLEDEWANNPGPVEACNHTMRKLAAIFVRGMIYNGIRPRLGVSLPAGDTE